MSGDRSHRAPLTLKLLVKVNEILASRGMTRDDLRVELNHILCAGRRIPPTHAGMVSLNRLLNPTGSGWSEPRGEMVLALKEWVEKIS